MIPPRVVNVSEENHDLYIGRPSMWGNPYKIGRDGTREEVIQQYRRYLWNEINNHRISLEDFLLMESKRLGCHCAPLPCHGDVLVRAFKHFFRGLENC